MLSEQELVELSKTLAADAISSGVNRSEFNRSIQQRYNNPFLYLISGKKKRPYIKGLRDVYRKKRYAYARLVVQSGLDIGSLDQKHKV